MPPDFGYADVSGIGPERVEIVSVNGGIYQVTNQMCIRTVQALSWFSSKYCSLLPLQHVGWQNDNFLVSGAVYQYTVCDCVEDVVVMIKVMLPTGKE